MSRFMQMMKSFACHLMLANALDFCGVSQMTEAFLQKVK